MATKKIKKVETPIDQRETFVSLQKNFADSDVSVEEKLKTLYALQEADSAIDKIIQLRGELPSEVEALEDEIDLIRREGGKLLAGEVEDIIEDAAENASRPTVRRVFGAKYDKDGFLILRERDFR